MRSEKLAVTEEEVHMGWSIIDKTKRSQVELCNPERQASKGQENY